MRDDVPTVGWLLAQFPLAFTLEKLFGAAAYEGRTRLLRFILDERQFVPPAAKYTSAFRRACGAGHLELVKILWQHSARCEIAVTVLLSADTIRCTVQQGQLDVLEYLWQEEQGAWCHNARLVAAAVGSGRLDVLAWVQERNPGAELTPASLPHTMFEYLAAAGHLEMLKHLHDRGLSRDSDCVMIAAAVRGQRQVCEWLYEQQNSSRDMWGVLMSQLRSVPILAEPHEREQALSRDQKAFIDVAHWLWDRSVREVDGEPVRADWLLELAAKHGVLQIVRDIVELQPEINLRAALELAVKYGRVDTVRFLVHRGARLNPLNADDDVPDCVRECGERQYLETLLVLQESHECRTLRSLLEQLVHRIATG
ncbi:hypothetical protein PINS_up015131 [Pythium insidiosum]|nr:hypothetical protein PINS_up015131 [Pythium insidiosum]